MPSKRHQPHVPIKPLSKNGHRQAASRHKQRYPRTSQILLILSAGLLIASVGLGVHYYNRLSFVFLHHPSHTVWAKPAAGYQPPTLPKFDVSMSLSASRLTVGETQTVSLAVTANRDQSATVRVWINSPAGKQVFKSPKAVVTHFSKGVTQTIQYSFAPTPVMPKGTYYVSDSIISVDTQTDYYAHQKSAEFTLL